MVALIDSMTGDHPARPVVAVCNNADAGGLAKAQARGVATEVVDHRPFKGNRPAFEAVLNETLERHDPDVICFAGFMRIFTDHFISHWQGRMINIHPSILPLFKGLHTHARALEAGVAVHGCTVHVVTEELDSGPILGQAVVPVRGGDTPDRLAARVLKAEHLIYPRALQAFARDPDALLAAPISMLGLPDDG